MFAKNNSHKRKHALFLYLIATLLVTFISGQVYAAEIMLPGVDPGGELNKMVEIFRNSINLSASIIINPAKNILYTLLLIDIAWTCINWILDESDLQSIIGTFVKKIIYSVLMYCMIDFAANAIAGGNLMANSNWLATIPNSFAGVGNSIATQNIWSGSVNSNVSGQGITLDPMNISAPLNNINIGDVSTMAINPGTILNQGIAVAFAFLGKVLMSFIGLGAIMPWNIMANLLIFIVALLVCCMIVMMFALLAADLAINFIEAYICMAVGIFLIGFSGSRWTMANFNVFLAYLFGLGLRILLNIAVYAIGVKMIMMTLADAGGINSTNITGQNNGAWNVVIETTGVVFIFFMIVKGIPDIAAGMASNSPMMTAGAGLKAGVSGIRGGMVGAAVGGQVLGAGLTAGGRAMMGKSSVKEERFDAKTGEKIKPDGKNGTYTQPLPPDQVSKKSYDGGSSITKDLKTALNNALGRKGSTSRQAYEAKMVGGSISDVIKSSMGAKGEGHDGRDMAKMTGGRLLNITGKALSFASRSLDPNSTKDAKTGEYSGTMPGGGGNAGGKLIGGTLTKVAGSGALNDAPGANYLSTFRAENPD